MRETQANGLQDDLNLQQTARRVIRVVAGEDGDYGCYNIA